MPRIARESYDEIGTTETFKRWEGARGVGNVYAYIMATKTTSAIAESVSELLRQAREEAGLDVREVAVRTRIPEKYILMFEERTLLAEAPEDAYTKIYLKAYGKFLGFDTASIVDLHRRERLQTPRSVMRAEPTERKHPLTAVGTSSMLVTPRVIHNALLGLAGAGLVAYLIYGVIALISPPKVTLLAPYDGMITTDRNILIEGRTEKEASVTINGKTVSPDENGKFRDTIDLQEGVNTITVSGTKKYSKAMAVNRRVIVLPRSQAVTAVGETMPIVEEVR